LKHVLQPSISEEFISVGALLVVSHQEWHPWRFDNVPSSYWSDAKNVCFFLQNLHGKLLLGSDASEWYKVTSSDFIKHQVLRLFVH